MCCLARGQGPGWCLERWAAQCGSADKEVSPASPTAHLLRDAFVWSARREGRSAGAPASTALRVPRRAACVPGSPLPGAEGTQLSGFLMRNVI